MRTASKPSSSAERPKDNNHQSKVPVGVVRGGRRSDESSSTPSSERTSSTPRSDSSRGAIPKRPRTSAESSISGVFSPIRGDNTQNIEEMEGRGMRPSFTIRIGNDQIRSGGYLGPSFLGESEIYENSAFHTARSVTFEEPVEEEEEEGGSNTQARKEDP